MAFTDEQRERYSRQMMLEEIGEEGQEKLAQARVLVIGAGGLGSPALMYLAASGVGTLGIADGDAIDISNMQRQVIHSTRSVGMAKAESAARRIKEINPHVNTIVYGEHVTAGTIQRIIKDYDFVLDCVDNFPARFMINDACVLEKIPFCHGGICGFAGQVMTYVPGQGPCYRCLFEEIPEKEVQESGSQGGVIASLPGIIGSLQALEAQKYILGAGELLTGKMLTFDGLSMQARTVKLGGPSAYCRVCGKDADIREIRPEQYGEREAGGQKENENHFEDIFSRIELLLGKDVLERLRQARVAVFGVGGVGGYVAEALARTGVGAIDLIDHDTVSRTNINRQIIALHSTLGRYKTDVMKERILDINPDCVVRIHRCFYLPETEKDFDFSEYDYIADCVDTVTAKIGIVVHANRCGTPVISSMGAGNKLEPARFEVADIFQTSVCPLAKVMRRELKKRGIKELKVVYSKEEPIRPGHGEEKKTGEPGKKGVPGSTAFVPSVAGLILASEIIRSLSGEVISG